MNIPNYENSQFTERNGYLTAIWSLILQQLITELQKNAGPEGLVAPTLTASQITAVQNNQLADGTYTCQYGTILYNSTANSIMIAVNNGSGVPIFKTVTLT